MRTYYFILLVLIACFMISCQNRESRKETAKHPAVPVAVKKLTAMDTLLLDLENLKKDTALKHASLSYHITDYSNGNQIPVVTYNADMSLVPASVMKVLTTAAALEILGEARSFRTSLQYDGMIENRILKGNLYIRGGGDPTFGAPSTFERWARAVKDLGIDSIAGSVIGDPRAFSRFSIPATWTWGELLLPYCAPASGLTYSGNVFQGTGHKNKKGKYKVAAEDLEPEIPGLEVENDIADAEGAPAETFLQGNPVALKMSIQGTVEKGNSFFPYIGVIPDPAMVAANDFTKKLNLLGVRVGGPPANIENADSAILSSVQKERIGICAAFSPSVAALVTLTNIHSNNLFAEDLSKQIGLAIYKSGHSESGCKAVLQFWKSKGIDTDGMFLYDGCGVSRYDGVTCRQLADILFYMTRSPSFTTFYNSLPLAGVSGTLAKYMKGTKAEGNLRAKTGSISRVKSYSGYVRTASGKRFIFAILVNNFTCSGPEMVKKLEKIMVDMASVK
ncbi:MAG: D-alanyl-D-alanine carboxypeptidase/D-alanyl-D-alanine-endopeptidase [Bacteroidetes bacterium]|nr:D-alanyl-D-alanine carboxypeptidase/D-alanyl-D-alanine-endopeptidase [Bacteroidota bacterium]